MAEKSWRLWFMSLNLPKSCIWENCILQQFLSWRCVQCKRRLNSSFGHPTGHKTKMRFIRTLENQISRYCWDIPRIFLDILGNLNFPQFKDILENFQTSLIFVSHPWTFKFPAIPSYPWKSTTQFPRYPCKYYLRHIFDVHIFIVYVLYTYVCIYM